MGSGKDTFLLFVQATWGFGEEIQPATEMSLWQCDRRSNLAFGKTYGCVWMGTESKASDQGMVCGARLTAVDSQLLSADGLCVCVLPHCHPWETPLSAAHPVAPLSIQTEIPGQTYRFPQRLREMASRNQDRSKCQLQTAGTVCSLAWPVAPTVAVSSPPWRVK